MVGEAARRTQLTETLKPTSLELVDDSAKHAGHAAMRGTGATESHFQYGVASRVHVATDTERDRWARVGRSAARHSLTVVSDAFQGQVRMRARTRPGRVSCPDPIMLNPGPPRRA